MRTFVFQIIVFFSLCLCPLTTYALEQDSIHTTRFGQIDFAIPEGTPTGAIFVLLDRQQPNELAQHLRSSAQALVETEKAFVAFIDATSYFSQIEKDADDCYFLGGEFERLSQVIQKNAGLENMHKPLLVGSGRGAALAYIILTQSPNSFSGGLSVEMNALLNLPNPFCDGRPRATQPTKKTLLVDASQPPTLPWYSLANWSENDFAEKIRTLRAKWAETKVTAPPVITHSAEISQLPLEELPSKNPTGHAIVILLSGDGGWATLDRQIGKYLSEHGVSVIGFNSLKYFWNEKTPEEAASALSVVIEHYRHAWKTDRVVLAGFSFGADALPVIINKLPSFAKHHVSSMILLSPGRNAEFEVHLSDWLDLEDDETGPDLLSELTKPGLPKLLCLYGSEEADESVCPQLPDTAGTKREIDGSHHFDGDYEMVAKIILEFIGFPQAQATSC